MFTFLIYKALAVSGVLANPLQDQKIEDIISNIAEQMLLIGAPIVGIMVIYGGFLILTAQDDPEKIKSGKDVIKWAVVGYTIIICAYGVVAIVKQVIGIS